MIIFIFWHGYCLIEFIYIMIIYQVVHLWMVYTTFYIFIILIYTSIYMSHHREKYLGYMLKDSIFLYYRLNLNVFWQEQIGKNKTKQKSMKLGLQVLNSLFVLNSESFLSILGEKRSHKNYITVHDTLEPANNFLKNFYT